MFETDKIKKRGHYIPSLFYWNCQEIQGFSFKKKEKKKNHPPLVPHFKWSLSGVQMRLTWFWAGCIWNYIATYLALRRDASVTASGRTRCYVGTQFREHQKRLSIAIFMAIYGRLWQFFYEKKHKSIIIKSQTKKRVHHELMVHPPKTTNNFTKLITYQSSSFCLPASLLHPM